MKKKYYKTLYGGMKSANGNCVWEVGAWKKFEKKLELCSNGFHCSGRIVDAMAYVAPDIVAEVEVRGESIDDGDKSVHEEMRIVRAWEWGKADSVALAVYAAGLVIDIYEAACPGDPRPREAIRAAKRWLRSPTAANTKAAAWAAGAAAWAAVRAAWAADAADAAWAAAWAAEAAEAAAAAWAARAAAWATAWAAVRAAAVAGAAEKTLDETERWIRRRLREKCQELS